MYSYLSLASKSFSAVFYFGKFSSNSVVGVRSGSKELTYELKDIFLPNCGGSN
jgi:hypothetical protein